MMLDRNFTILEMLHNIGAVRTNGHYVYTKGGHGTDYVAKDVLYRSSSRTSHVGKVIADAFMNDFVSVVVGPVVGGAILAQWIAYHLSADRAMEVESVFADKTADGSFALTRGYDLVVARKKVLIAEDVLNTGGSVQQTIAAVRNAGGNVVGVGALCNRGGVTAAGLDVPKLVALANVDMKVYSEAECKLHGPCSRGVPINTDLGKGAEYLARKNLQPVS